MRGRAAAPATTVQQGGHIMLHDILFGGLQQKPKEIAGTELKLGVTMMLYGNRNFIFIHSQARNFGPAILHGLDSGSKIGPSPARSYELWVHLKICPDDSRT